MKYSNMFKIDFEKHHSSFGLPQTDPTKHVQGFEPQHRGTFSGQHMSQLLQYRSNF